MSWVVKTLGSSIGSKYVMALTGVGLLLFVIIHMVANLQVFAGPERLNAYAVTLRAMPSLLWIARVGLGVLFLLHLVMAVRLTRANRGARPVAYRMRKPVVSSAASRSMMLGGVFLVAFIGYHLAHFTFGLTHPEHFGLTDSQGRSDVFQMVVLGFREPLVSALYILAMAPLAMHIAHGASSFFQSLGWNHPRCNPLMRAVGPVFGVLIFLGNISMPLAVMAGFITQGGGQ